MCAVTSTSQPELYRPDMQYVWVMNSLANNTVTDTKYIQRPSYDTNVSCYGKEKGSNLTSPSSDWLYLNQTGIHAHYLYYYLLCIMHYAFLALENFKNSNLHIIHISRPIQITIMVYANNTIQIINYCSDWLYLSQPGIHVH